MDRPPDSENLGDGGERRRYEVEHQLGLADDRAHQQDEVAPVREDLAQMELEEAVSVTATGSLTPAKRIYCATAWSMLLVAGP